MGEFPRESDGRRVFTVEFKRGVVQQLLKGEKTLAEVSRELDIQPSVARQWKRRFEAGATAAVATNEDVVPVSALTEAHQRIRELERLLGKKQMEIDLRLSAGVGHGEPDISRRLQPQAYSAAHAHARLDAAAARASSPRTTAPGPGAAAGIEPTLLLGHRPDSILERRGSLGGVRDRSSRSRSVRVDGLTPPAERRGHPDAHGQSALGTLRRDRVDGAARDQWLSDNGPQYTATASVLYAHELGVVPITTPSYSPESNGAGRRLRAHVQTRLRERPRTEGRRERARATGRLDRRLQPLGAAFGARHAEPGRLPGELRTYAPICLRDWEADHS